MNINIVTPEITAAAERIAQARLDIEAAGARLARAASDRDRLEGNTTRLQNDRGGIIARRQAGNTQPDDGARLALIAADLDGLTSLMADAEAVVAASQAESQRADAMLQAALAGMQVAEDRAVEAALVDHAQRLEVAMLSTIGRLAEIHRRRGSGMPPWGPSRNLALELRRLQAARHEL